MASYKVEPYTPGNHEQQVQQGMPHSNQQQQVYEARKVDYQHPYPMHTTVYAVYRPTTTGSSYATPTTTTTTTTATTTTTTTTAYKREVQNQAPPMYVAAAPAAPPPKYAPQYRH